MNQESIVNYIVEEIKNQVMKPGSSRVAPVPELVKEPPPLRKRLISEHDIRICQKSGRTQLKLSKDSIITPLASDLAAQCGIHLMRV